MIYPNTTVTLVMLLFYARRWIRNKDQHALNRFVDLYETAFIAKYGLTQLCDEAQTDVMGAIDWLVSWHRYHATPADRALLRSIKQGKAPWDIRWSS